jgi:hypothetical protein
MRKLFRNLSLDSALKRNTTQIEYYINESINKHDAQECLDIFNMIGLPSERYTILENYIDICQSTSININNNFNKKITSTNNLCFLRTGFG